MSMCWEKIKAVPPTHIAKWNPTDNCVDHVIDNSIEARRRQLKAANTSIVVENETARIDNLTEAELDAELGG